ncbi:heterokaryon incompatibility protein-domain-containing protein [Echria macrotheca]|uniref:Heterokaryon incompatibility protein-domain-containing protein n=1 Tax=Echria macrotheca TaxID=438768 RepID=A0AAJ0B1K6_9PEZI|nr:heterokaryon incompatibility protein-domain-containing protein [Echria macrotheca]
MERTYRNLINPLPAKYNLANASITAPLQTCEACSVAWPDRSKAKNNIIKTGYERVDSYPDFPSLKTSSRNGCGLCWIIRKALRSSWAVRPMEEWGVGPLEEDNDEFADLLSEPWDGKVRIFNLSFGFVTFSDIDGTHATKGESACSDQRGGMVTSMMFEFGPVTPKAAEDGSVLHGEISQVLGFKVFDSVDIKSNVPNHQRMLPDQYTLSDRNISMIQTWIEDCESNHPSCRSFSSEPKFLPTRLINVGTRDKVPPHLVETKDMSTDGITYAALSHMWGDVLTAPPLQAMQYNYRQLMEYISPRRLPRNFLDAVETCRCIGIQYLWIDSLCILQDSTDDWMKEAQTMHLVYKYAKVTIVATSATSSHDGFLSRRLSAVPAVKIRYGPAEQTLVITPIDDHENGLRRGDIDGSKWNTRGWTMQERALSTRSIHFCNNKIYYECRGRLLSEENEAETFQVSFLWPRPPESVEYDDSVWYDRWTRAVIEYSKRRFTVQTDRVIAIKSIANEMAAHFPPGSYLAGQATWQGNIANELLWYVEAGIPRRLPDIPTWSWVSLDAHISFVKGTRSSSDPEQHLSGVPFSASYSFERERLCATGFLVDITRFEPVQDHHYTRASFPYDVVGGNNNRLFAHGMLDMDNRDNILGMEVLDLWYLHVSDEQRPSGLVLQRSPGFAVVNEFRRVGVATVFPLGEDLLDSEQFSPPLHANQGPRNTVAGGEVGAVHDLILL